MNQSVYYNGYQPAKGKSAAVLAVCALGTTAIGWLCLFLSGAMRFVPPVDIPVLPGRVLTSIIWTVFYLLAGCSLYLSITAPIPNSVYRAVRLWTLALWAATAVLMFVWPFLVYGAQTFALAYVWLAVCAACLSALIVLDFKLRPAAAFLLLPLAVWLFFSAAMVLQLVLAA